MKKTLTTDCIKSIKGLIISGELLPGEHIKGEYLRNKLGVGLSPIREALSYLSAGFLVDFIDNVGFKVTSIDKEKVYKAYFANARLDSLMLEYSILEGDDVWEALVIGSLHRLSKLEMQNQPIPYDVWKKCNDEFHDVLVSGCKNSFLLQSRLNFIDFKNWINSLIKSYPLQLNYKVSNFEHSRIAKLVVARKLEESSSLLFKHNMKGLDKILMELKKASILI